MDYSSQIEKLRKEARKFRRSKIRNFSQVGEKYDPKKFGHKTTKNRF